MTTQKPKVLVVLTSADKVPKTGKQIGWYLPELAHPFHVLNPLVELVYASPKGGVSPLDPVSVDLFKEDPVCKDFLENHTSVWEKTTKLSDFAGRASEFDAIFYPGGHGPMVDLADDQHSKDLLRDFHSQGKVISAVCHGPAALVNAITAAGEPLLKGVQVTGFDNVGEEMFQFTEDMDFSLEDRLGQVSGGNYVKAAEGPLAEKVVVDGKIITGQNPASSKGVAEEIAKALGVYAVLPRASVRTRHSVRPARPRREPTDAYPTAAPVGYFEAWNEDRPCLWMDASELESMTDLTHVHFSFAKLTESFEVDVSEVSYQFNKFKKLKGPNRILAFGGWVDSTHPTKYHILRNAAKQQNRLKVAKNIAAFIKSHDIGGVDSDWEYPRAPDIPNIPPAYETNGSNYLGMLTLLKAQLRGKSLSIAAPASFWCLKPYLIEKMAKVADYIIYIAYNLHGQWDYDNKWASLGYLKGDCLRSHVNLTETLSALSMITKAGVPSTKVIVGATSYGRSFKMAKVGCPGPMCKFLGSSTESLARKGICTGTSGYISNAEIDDLIDKRAKSIKKWLDDSDSDILVYDDTEWVAYMSESTKRKRISKYGGLNFGGVTDWAVDLQKFGRSEGGSFIEIIEEDLECKWMSKDGFDCLDKAVTNSSMEPIERWNQLRAPCAWRDVVQNWLKERDGEDIDVDKYPSAFTRSASMLLDGPESFNYALFSNLYMAVQLAENGIQSKLESLVETFAPSVDDSAQFNLVADMLGVALGMFSAPLFNKNGAPPPADDLKDLIANSASWGATIAKDVQNSKRLSDSAKVAGTLGDLSFMLTNATTQFMKQVFRGDDKSVKYLDDMIAGDSSNNKNTKVSMPELHAQITKVFHAILIPETWKVSAKLAPAFVIDLSYDCNAVGPLNNDYIAPSTAQEMGYCYDLQAQLTHQGPGCNYNKEQIAGYCYKGRRYYILAPNGDATRCGNGSPPANGGAPPCHDRYFTEPWNIQNFNSSSAWSGINKEDLIAGAVARWELRGKKNRGGFIDMTKAENYDFLLGDDPEETDIRTAGIVQTPACSPEKARSGWKYGSSLSSTQKDKLLDALPYYPCPNT